MWMGEERMPKKMLHTKQRENGHEVDPEPWIDQIRKDIEMRKKNWQETQENKKWEN